MLSFEARVKEIRKNTKGIKNLIKQCDRILLLLKNKSHTVDAERWYTVLEKTSEKRKEKKRKPLVLLAFIISHSQSN